MQNETEIVDGKIVLLGEDNSGRDSMNLAGNPFALLQAPTRTGQTYILNEWTTKLRDGRTVKASWNVKGDQILGLPGPLEELLFLVLLELTREAAGGADSSEWPQKVFFSQYDLLERLKLSDRGRDYKKISEAFLRLHAVRVQAENSFFDARTGLPHKTIGFQILNNFALSNEPKGRKGQTHIPLSWFEWDSILWQSFLDGNVRSLALDFVLSLESPTARRLFRYLDMMREQTTPPRKEFTIGVMKLRDRLGMQNHKYASKVKQVLAPAIEELKSRHYLKSADYQDGKEGEVITFRFASASPLSNPNPVTESPQKPPKRQRDTVVIEAEPSESDIRADALKCHTVFISLPESERDELLAIARKDVIPIWHDRIGVPESPMSLGLWQLVAQRYPEKVK